MNALETELEYPFGDALPLPDAPMQIAPGIFWVRLELPFRLNHINTWLIRDEVHGQSGWCVVDCGIDQPSSRAQWESIFAHHLDGLPVVRVVVTHMHPDHIGLAHWICGRWKAPMWISTTDFMTARSAMQLDIQYGGEAAAQFHARHGLLDESALNKVSTRGDYYRALVPALPHQHHRLMDQAVLTLGQEDWVCHAGHGHSPEHMALHSAEQGILISGDMVLPRISTNVSVFDSEPEADPLLLYMQSLERMRTLPAHTLVLPSHGRPFRGLHRRIDQLQSHHHERLAELAAACATKAMSGMDAVELLFARDLDAHQLTFALGEAIAHLHTLWHQGQLIRTVDEVGVYRFKAKAEWSRS
ncbi:MAG: hypothetical protein RL307_1277 [Pseudomonadota bacterium]